MKFIMMTSTHGHCRERALVNLTIKQSIKANGMRMASGRAEAFRSGKTDQNTKVIGEMTKQMEWGV